MLLLTEAPQVAPIIRDSLTIYALLISAVFGLLTTIFTQGWQAWIAARDRRWKIEDANREKPVAKNPGDVNSDSNKS